MQRVLVHRLLSELPADPPDPLPPSVRTARDWPDRRAALVASHFPPLGADIGDLNTYRTPAQRRLIFEEFFLFQAGLVVRARRRASEHKSRAVRVDDGVREAARRVLPFRLTEGQRTALKEIVTDMQRPEPMNRLLQGDVGAGKTIVALLAAVVAMENGFQVAFMAPTEILADQHYLTIRRLLDRSRFRVASLTGVWGGAAGCSSWNGAVTWSSGRAGRTGVAFTSSASWYRRAASVWRGATRGVADEGLES
jgi:ATP-dependent DNA helicase RecG